MQFLLGAMAVRFRARKGGRRAGPARESPGEPGGSWVFHNLSRCHTEASVFSLRSWTVAANSGSLRISSRILLVEWMTVEWSFPPKRRPISVVEARESSRERYMAIWRGRATDWERF